MTLTPAFTAGFLIGGMVGFSLAVIALAIVAAAGRKTPRFPR